MLSRLALMVQAAVLGGQFFDLFSLFDDDGVASKVGVGWSYAADALMVALVVVVIDEGADDGRGSAFCQPVAQGFAVIALVGDEFGGGRHGFDTALGDLAIMDVSWCQEQDEGPAFRIADSAAEKGGLGPWHRPHQGGPQHQAPPSSTFR